MKRRIFLSITSAASIFLPYFVFDSPTHALTFSVASICLLLWISEAVPPFVPTLVLWLAIPLVIGWVDQDLTIQKVLGWSADPVVALFFGGFVIGVAAERNGLAQRIIVFAVQKAGSSYQAFLLIAIVSTAMLSMWMSNIAAAALVLACLHPMLSGFDRDDIIRRTMLVGVALGADLGGIATPIGTGPNAIAIASISSEHPISFVHWMLFALPLTVGMIGASFLLLAKRLPKSADLAAEAARPVFELPKAEHPDGSGSRFAILLAFIVSFWLTEPLHGIPASLVSIGAAVAVFGFGYLRKEDLKSIDWSTLLLIMGGITMGRLLEHSGIIKYFSGQVPFGEFHPVVTIFLFCLASAVLSALMSNTATAILLIPIATVFIPYPSTAVLVAIAASFGIPFVISTPPNAMAYGEGGVRFGDLFWPGLAVMIGGCLLIALTGRPILRLAGID